MMNIDEEVEGDSTVVKIISFILGYRAIDVINN
jgi:hypothetical protein